jgi:hypothetical protein
VRCRVCGSHCFLVVGVSGHHNNNDNDNNNGNPTTTILPLLQEVINRTTALTKVDLYHTENHRD